jgi:hypothetical protein
MLLDSALKLDYNYIAKATLDDFLTDDMQLIYLGVVLVTSCMLTGIE